MTDLLLQIVANNLAIALVLALVARAVQGTGKQPLLSHLLWLLVLVKLVTPPLFTVPLVAVPGLSSSTPTASEGARLDAGATGAVSEGAAIVPLAAILPASGEASPEASTSPVESAKLALLLIWLLGSAGVFAWSVGRIYRFHRLLKRASRVAGPELQRLARRVGRQLGVRRTPVLCTTSAHVSPMVWWIGGRVRILIPSTLLHEMDSEQLRWILAHELAHVRRRDHLVRWLEWLACVSLWWNPVAWWARRNLRVNEELCCDSLVLSSLRPEPRVYASSLMTVVEFLASPAIRPPAMASEINSGGFLERRFRMIVSGKVIPTPSRWLQTAVVVCAVVLSPLGLLYAADPGDEGPSEEQRRTSLVDHYKKLGIEKEKLGGMKDHLVEKGVAAEVLERVLGGMLRVIHEARSEGEKFDLNPRLEAYFTELGLTTEQIDLVVGWSRRIAANPKDRNSKIEDHYRKLGVDGGVMKRIAMHLHENGVPREKLEEVLEGMVKVIHEMKSEGDRFDLDPRLRDYFWRLGLEHDQIELVQALARRVLQAPDRKDTGLEDHFRKLGISKETVAKVRSVLVERGGIDKERIGSALGAMIRIILAIQSDGERFELDPRIREYLSGRVELTDEQIDVVVRAAQRVAGGLKARAKKDSDEPDWKAIQHRIEGAVEAGEITREEADRKYRAIKEKMAASRSKKQKTLDWDEIKRKIEGAVEAGKMTREEADAKYRAIKKKEESKGREK